MSIIHTFIYLYIYIYTHNERVLEEPVHSSQPHFSKSVWAAGQIFVVFPPKPAEATTGGQYREIGLLTQGQRERTSSYNGPQGTHVPFSRPLSGTVAFEDHSQASLWCFQGAVLKVLHIWLFGFKMTATLENSFIAHSVDGRWVQGFVDR